MTRKVKLIQECYNYKWEGSMASQVYYYCSRVFLLLGDVFHVNNVRGDGNKCDYCEAYYVKRRGA